MLLNTDRDSLNTVEIVYLSPPLQGMTTLFGSVLGVCNGPGHSGSMKDASTTTIVHQPLAVHLSICYEVTLVWMLGETPKILWVKFLTGPQSKQIW
jgi:hypothetical protein